MSACLYRALDPEGNPLYIGYTLDGPRRLAEHRGRSEWWTRVATIEIQHYATREDAMDAEAKAIRDERPECNQRLPFDAAQRDELAARREVREDVEMATVACTGCGRSVEMEAEIVRLASESPALECRCGGFWTHRRSAA